LPGRNRTVFELPPKFRKASEHPVSNIELHRTETFVNNRGREDRRTGFAESGVSNLWRCTRNTLRTE
jgi:hypothetical protein